MLEKIAGIIIMSGLILSVTGSIVGHETIKTAGNLTLLITIIVAGFMFLRYYITTPVIEFSGTCIEQKRYFSHYKITFRSGSSGIFSGRASLHLGENIKIGDKAKVKVKGQSILQLKKIN